MEVESPQSIKINQFLRMHRNPSQQDKTLQPQTTSFSAPKGRVESKQKRVHLSKVFAR